MTGCYLSKKLKLIFTFMLTIGLLSCRRNGSEPAIIEDLGIALQTIKHQIQLATSSKSNDTQIATIETSDKKTSIDATQLAFEEKNKCEIKNGYVLINYVDKKTKKSSHYRAEFIGKNRVKLRLESESGGGNVYELKLACETR